MTGATPANFHPSIVDAMILQPLRYSVANLLHSPDCVALVQLEGEALKNMILDLMDRGWGAVTVEAVSGEHWLIFAANAIHEGNLIGDIRRWSREHGYQFFVKRSGEELTTPTENSFVLPDGRVVEIHNVLVRSSNFTHWGLSHAKVLPAGYIRL